MSDAATSTRTIDELVQAGLPLVQYAVSDLAGRIPRHVRRDDLMSAGMLGLAQAASSWDPSRGVTFERFARTRIGGALLDELRSRDWASRSVRANARRLQSTTDELTARLGHAPTTDELASAMGVAPDDVTKLVDDVHRATVLHYDAMFTDIDDSAAAMAPGAPDEALDTLLAKELVGYLRDAVMALPQRLCKVVVEYFFEERQMQDIADDLGVTESRVSQMRAEAVALLRDGINSQLAPEEVPALGETSGRVAKRKAAYYSAIAGASDLRTRIEAGSAGAVTASAAVRSA
jgi:RNA polymerase sigma factor FliA